MTIIFYAALIISLTILVIIYSILKHTTITGLKILTDSGATNWDESTKMKITLLALFIFFSIIFLLTK